MSAAMPMLPGQAAAPPGPADLSMMYVLHHGFRRDLARFAEAVRRTPGTDRVTWRALHERWRLFAVLLHDHHHKEDEILWPLLRERSGAAADDGALRVLDEMEAEHATIDPVLERAAAGFAEMAADPDATLVPGLVSDLVDTLELAQADLGAHLDHEERDAIAVLQRHVGSDWAEIERKQFRGGLGPRELARMIPWAVEGLPDAVVKGMLAAAPPFRVFLLVGRRGFARLEAAAFAHVPAGTGA